MTGLAIFDFGDRTVRSLEIDGAPWFVGKDVCACLEITDHHQALGRLDPDEIRGGCIVPTPSAAQTMKVISEAGVYRLVFTSRTEVAGRFKRWLAHDVLPALRRTGRYEMPEASAAQPVTGKLSSADLMDLRHSLMSLGEYRRLFGARAARELARMMPIPIPELELRPGECHVEAFAGDAIVRAAGSRMRFGPLYDAYGAWCREKGRAPMTATGFGRRMRELGFLKRRSGGRMYYGDIELMRGTGEGASPPEAG